MQKHDGRSLNLDAGAVSVPERDRPSPLPRARGVRAPVLAQAGFGPRRPAQCTLRPDITVLGGQHGGPNSSHNRGRFPERAFEQARVVDVERSDRASNRYAVAAT
jgi:hypothetical protein